jgi:hypothetical protein
MPNLEGSSLENSSINLSLAGVAKLRGTAHLLHLPLYSLHYLGVGVAEESHSVVCVAVEIAPPWSSQTYCMKPRTILTPYSR